MISAKSILTELNRFYKFYLSQATQVEGRNKTRKPMMRVDQVATIILLYHASHFVNFKVFYIEYARKFLRRMFPKMPGYSWFLRMRPDALLFLLKYMQSKTKQNTGVNYIDSTPIKVCHNARINWHKTFRGIAARGHHSLGWFYGFKLHIITNTQGELMDIYLTKGNESDIIGLDKMGKALVGLLIGDRGYISAKHEQVLGARGLKLITRVRSNMKPKPLTSREKFYLYRRSLVETVIGVIKAAYKLENSRIRSIAGFLVQIFGALAAYTIMPMKPALSCGFNPLIRS